MVVVAWREKDRFENGLGREWVDLCGGDRKGSLKAPKSLIG